MGNKRSFDIGCRSCEEVFYVATFGEPKRCVFCGSQEIDIEPEEGVPEDDPPEDSDDGRYERGR